jgi:crotonobetainyl-CoA:carnitine CoA-transferase CaiB-like acyl-CoA transferase
VFEASDRAFSIAVGSEKLWSVFCQTIGRADLEAHPDYATNPRRVENRHALEETLGATFRERKASEWLERLGAAGVPCSPVRTFAEVAEDPQAAVRNMFPVIDCPKAGPHRVTGPPIKLAATPARPGAPAPELGEHTEAALAELLGLGAGALEELAASGVIFTGEGSPRKTAR